MWKEFTVYTSGEGLDAVAAKLDSMGIGQLELFEGRNRVEQYLNDASAFGTMPTSMRLRQRMNHMFARILRMSRRTGEL